MKDKMFCDVCGCNTDHLTIGRDGRPDECQCCYWTRVIGVEALLEQVATLTKERDHAVAMRAETEEGPCRWCDREAILTKEQPNAILQRAYTMACLERDEAREELKSVLSDWNALVKASGSLTHGTAIGVVARLRADHVKDGEG